ncbi:hypothetical protein [Nocardioides aurantiacus]|uniref:Lipoprotein LpqN n=1 Tax=Nocardioides aurantiacus TaxID=86796 RepID=A0A3N2CT96_9ACTN|nr:hypothetical protein [Nocardioides aurantiacus]ROR90759.1 hypothetical protein EDD33_1607 [Nocardioides aurantiacus]
MGLHQQLRRPTALGLTAAFLLAVTGCGGGEAGAEGADASASSSPSSSPSTEPSSSASSGSGPSDEDLGAVVAAEPEDLVWDVGTVPADWRKMSTETGTAQWQVAPGCLLTLQQPGGLRETTPTQEQIVRGTVDRIAQQSKVGVEPGTVRRAQFPVTSNVEGTSQSAAVSVLDFRAPKGVQGRVLAHRAGEFALILIAVCGREAFPQADKAEFAPFVRQLTIKATY